MKMTANQKRTELRRMHNLPPNAAISCTTCGDSCVPRRSIDEGTSVWCAHYGNHKNPRGVCMAWSEKDTCFDPPYWADDRGRRVSVERSIHNIMSRPSKQLHLSRFYKQVVERVKLIIRGAGRTPASKYREIIDIQLQYCQNVLHTLANADKATRWHRLGKLKQEAAELLHYANTAGKQYVV